MIFPLAVGGSSSHVCPILLCEDSADTGRVDQHFKELNHLQTNIIRIPQLMSNILRIQPLEQRARTVIVIEDWIESAKRILTQIQLRDNLEKTVVLRDLVGDDERRILIKSSFEFEEGRLLEDTYT